MIRSHKFIVLFAALSLAPLGAEAAASPAHKKHRKRVAVKHAHHHSHRARHHALATPHARASSAISDHSPALRGLASGATSVIGPQTPVTTHNPNPPAGGQTESAPAPSALPVTTPGTRTVPAASDPVASPSGTPVTSPSSTPILSPASVTPLAPGSMPFVPAGANATVGSLPSSSGPGDLNALEASTTFLNFASRIEGSDPLATAKLFGMVFQDCASMFKFDNTATDPTIQSASFVGFRISDTGGGRDCMAKHRGQSCGSGEGQACVRLSRLAGTSLNLAPFNDATIGIMHSNPNDDANPSSFEEFPGGHLAHKSTMTLAAEKAEADRKAHDELVKSLWAQYSNCLQVDGGAPISRKILDELTRISKATDPKVTADKYDATNVKEMNDFRSNIAKAKGPSDLETLRENFGVWALSHPDSVEDAAEIYHRIALKYLDFPNPGTEAFNSAASTIAEAQTLEGLSKTSRTRLEGYQRELKIGKVSNMAQQGWNGNMALQSNWQSLMYGSNGRGGLYGDVMNACNGPSASLEGCSSAMNSLKSAAQIPSQAQQAQQQQYAMQQAMNQQMQQAMNGNMGGGMGGMNGPNQGGAPLNPMGPMSPIGNNPSFAGNSGFGGGGNFGASAAFGGGNPGFTPSFAPSATGGQVMGGMNPGGPQSGMPGAGAWGGGSFGSTF